MSDLSSLSDRVAACARRMERADDPETPLARLYALVAVRLLRYAETITRHRDDAEDAVQAAMLRVAARPRQLARADEPFAWLMRVLRNEALMIVRRRGTRKIVPLEPGLPQETAVDPRHQLDADEIRWNVRQAILELPEEQKDVVVLKMWEQMTFAAIAVVLDIPADTAASRYRYALQKLSRQLSELAPLTRQRDAVRAQSARQKQSPPAEAVPFLPARNPRNNR